MKITRTRFLGFFALSLLLLAPAAVAQTKAEKANKKDVPFSVTRYQPSIDAFLKADQTNPPPKNAILFIGSSIFRQWTTLAEQMAPLPVFNRAFGGSRTPELLHYADTIVVPYAPKVIVYYCGSNDINAEATPAEIAGNVRKFVGRIHAALPKTRVIYVSILRAPQKKNAWDKVDAANRLVRDLCAKDARLSFVDVNPAVFGPDGQARLALYREDQLHYHPPAYLGFTAIIKPALADVWAAVK